MLGCTGSHYIQSLVGCNGHGLAKRAGRGALSACSPPPPLLVTPQSGTRHSSQPSTPYVMTGQKQIKPWIQKKRQFLNVLLMIVIIQGLSQKRQNLHNEFIGIFYVPKKGFFFLFHYYFVQGFFFTMAWRFLLLFLNLLF